MSIYNIIIRKKKRLISRITFGTDANHKVMLWCHLNSVTSQRGAQLQLISCQNSENSKFTRPHVYGGASNRPYHAGG